MKRSLSAEIAAVDEGAYHLVLASDCVHFQQSHDGLLTTIARTLAVGGIALLCQPRRGDSLKNFMALVDAVNGGRPLFRVTLLENFSPKVSSMHSSLVLGDDSQNSSDSAALRQLASAQYDPDRHRPLLLALRKMRSYDEDVDGEMVRNHFITNLLY